jgi:hypothetical protein
MSKKPLPSWGYLPGVEAEVSKPRPHQLGLGQPEIVQVGPRSSHKSAKLSISEFSTHFRPPNP